MKYFEVKHPYYALLKASDKADAMSKYNTSVSDLSEDEEMQEVSRDYALATFSRGKSEDGKAIPISDIVSDFNDEQVSLLLVDGGLL